MWHSHNIRGLELYLMKELPPQYNPKETEDKIYKLWEESGFFAPEAHQPSADNPNSNKTFSIIMPPPNVTGNLHVGHALMLVIEDILVRFERMRGKRTLWLPGTDHAAIATQSKVETLIYKQEGKTRFDLGRDEFLRRVEAFAKESRDTIVGQIKRLGSSVDWSREAYTLDDARTLAVRTAFERMHAAGLIVRGKRIVNWDPKLKTVVSDDEIDWKEEKAPFYYLKYGPFTIATARPETKFGDKYVVVHPKDKRYAQYQDGQKIKLEWINGPITATAIKDKSIDMEFGTGAMTITPWHDATDFDIAKRHGLDAEQIIDSNGKLLPVAGEFAGLHIKKARPLIVDKLRSRGLVVKTDEDYRHRIATSSRGGGTIEPQIQEQWFVDVNKEFALPHSNLKSVKKGERVSLKTLMRRVVESGEIKIVPEHFAKTYFHWIDNLRDWCVSRQIWYGHRIPVWYCFGCGEAKVNPKIKSRWFLVRHGESVWNRENRSQGQLDDGTNPLTDNGSAQAESVGKMLKQHDVGLIVSSDLERTRLTAEIISRQTGAPIIYDEQLRERHMGEAQGKMREENNKKFGRDLLWKYDAAPPGGESWRELEERAWEAFKKNKESHGHKNAVIVTHGGVIRALIKRFRNEDAETMLGNSAIENSGLVSLDILDPCLKCSGEFYEQDPDTLDTWFSSGLWTFSTLGWPGETNDLKVFHPTDILETGYDILFFWVARMILMTTYLVGDVPFRTVYLHGLVRDKDRQKMSKSKGNMIDPLGIIDTYGTDALRFALIFGSAPGNDVPLSEDKIRGMKHFANKLWNIARFVFTNTKLSTGTPRQGRGSASRRAEGGGSALDGETLSAKRKDAPKAMTDADKLILEKLAAATKEITEHLDALRLHEAAQTAYQFIWHEFADVYIEKSKAQLKDAALRANTETTLVHVLSASLTLLHPFMPFVTEEIWGRLAPDAEPLLIQRWPL